MALLFMDSFDHYLTADLAAKLWNSSGVNGGVTPQISAGTGRRGSGAFRLAVATASSSSSANLNRSVAAGDATCVIGLAVSIPSTLPGTSGLPLISIRDAASAQITVKVNSALTLTVLRGAGNGTVLGTTSGALPNATLAYLEVKVLIHPSAGTVDVRINGTSVLSLTAQNTRNTTNSSWNAIALGNIDANSTSWATTVTANIDLDDLYLLDGTGAAPWNTFLGDCRVDYRAPTAAGALTQWTPSAGANYAAVDDATPNGDTDYVSTPTVGLEDTYVTQDAPVAGATIYGVQPLLNIKKLDAGTCAVTPTVRQGGTSYLGTAQNPSTSYTYVWNEWQVNPATGLAWVEADFNADEFGFRKTA